MFDFSPLEKPQTAIHTVRHGSIEKRRLNHTALGIAAVKHRHFTACSHPFATVPVATIAQQLFDFIHHPVRLSQVARGLHHPNQLTRTLGGVQIFS